jgi:hypothetical protein|tara:strand:+ start:837 stop:1058 length:222 start_codon:yes stop_codon:yes gene_type:complete
MANIKKKAPGATTKDKVKRKLAQVKNRKVEKAFTATRGTGGLQDKGNPKDQGSMMYKKGGMMRYKHGGYMQHD